MHFAMSRSYLRTMSLTLNNSSKQQRRYPASRDLSYRGEMRDLCSQGTKIVISVNIYIIDNTSVN